MITRTSGLHKLAWRGVLDLLFTHSDGEGAKEQVKVVGPRGDSGHTDLKHVSQHLLLQACSNPAAEEKKTQPVADYTLDWEKWVQKMFVSFSELLTNKPT